MKGAIWGGFIQIAEDSSGGSTLVDSQRSEHDDGKCFPCLFGFKEVGFHTATKCCISNKPSGINLLHVFRSLCSDNKAMGCSVELPRIASIISLSLSRVLLSGGHHSQMSDSERHRRIAIIYDWTFRIQRWKCEWFKWLHGWSRSWLIAPLTRNQTWVNALWNQRVEFNYTCTAL